MAKFLDTTGISYHLEQLLKNARERVVLISPYLKMNDRIKELLDDKDRLKLDIRVVYGKGELQPDESNWLKTKTSIKTSYCKNLHAKCYMNEQEALITSMNLYDFSQANNNEMGIYVLKSEEAELFDSIYIEVGRLIRFSEDVKISVERVSPIDVTAKSSARKTERPSTKPALPEKGLCIRCKAPLKLDPQHPYCKECYGSWKQYENEKYEEKYCHICGRSNKSTLLKPTCLDCYKTYKDLLNFAL